MTRVLEPAGIIQAWGDLDDPRQRGRTIIDSLMNTPLLFWASQTTGDDRYADAARRHTAQLREHILRPDGTTFHTFYWDPAQRRAAARRDRAGQRRRLVLGPRAGVGHLRVQPQPPATPATPRCSPPRGLRRLLPRPPAGRPRRLLGPGLRRRQRPGARQLGRGHRRLRPGRAGRQPPADTAGADRYRAAAGRDPRARSSTATPPPATRSRTRCCCTASTTSPRASASTREPCGATTSTWKR